MSLLCWWTIILMLLLSFRCTKALMMNVRVVSYNVLSSHLASPSHFTTLNPDHLLAENRLPVVLQKLQDEMQQHADMPLVFCLQEVSYDWAGPLHALLSTHNFHVVTGLYGRSFNGYMGVLLAWNTQHLQTVDVSIQRLADTAGDDYWPPRDVEPGLLYKAWSKLYTTAIETPLRAVGMLDQQWPAVEHWQYARSRMNVILTATLSCRGRTFCVATYHMPCAYYAPKVMTIHAELAAWHVQQQARKAAAAAASNVDDADTNMVPYIFAGDFNIKPREKCYELLATNLNLPEDDAFYPTPKNGKAWRRRAVPMQSAYAEYSRQHRTSTTMDDNNNNDANHNDEPDFTNYARVGERDPFIDTLDYIFLSPGQWRVTAVKALRHRDQAGGPYPNLNQQEPSDHVLLAATLSLD